MSGWLLVAIIGAPCWALLGLLVGMVIGRGIRVADQAAGRPLPTPFASLSVGTVPGMASPQDPTAPIPAVLGWSNGPDGTAGGENLRLYALDAGQAPRWDKGGRTIERAIRERHPNYEGDRYLVFRVGTRHEDAEAMPHGWMEAVGELWAEVGKDPHLAPTAQQLAELIRRASPELATAVVAHLRLQIDESHRCWVEDHAGQLRQLRADREADTGRLAAAIRTYADTDDGEPLHELDEHAEALAGYLTQRGLARG